MSQVVFVESSPVTANALHCSECDDEGKEPCLKVGQAAIERHREQEPKHQKYIWLRQEIV